jgi:L-asparaginase II
MGRPADIARHLGGHHHGDHSHEHPRAGGPAEYSAALVELARGGLGESLHRGAVAVCRPDGVRVRGLGHPSMPTFLRSAAKPLQALPLIATGAADALGLEPAELAVCCGSLNGEPFQVEAVRSVLAKAGVGPEALACGVHRPSHRPTARALRQAGERPTELHNNCAGKHAAMLAICAHQGWEARGYTQASHPVQRLMLHAVAEMCAYPAEQIGVGVDGCGVPVFRLPLVALAGAYARLAAPAAGGLAAETAAAAARIMEACLAHPEMIAGTGRLCTRVMQAAPGRLLAKTGAEGTYALALAGQGLGVALNVEDGAMRALSPAVTELLHQLGELGHDALEGPLADLHRPALTNHRGEAVADLAAVFALPG